MGADVYSERLRPMFRNFEILNIKKTKDGIPLFIFELIMYFFLFELLEHSKYMIIFYEI